MYKKGILATFIVIFLLSSVSSYAININTSIKDENTKIKPLTVPKNFDTRRAVIVGIANYQNINDLRYTDDDAKGMKYVLEQNGWSSDNIKLLVDNQAGKNSIISNLNSMASQEDSDDISLFFFSGHGTTKFDTDGDETDDNYDEALCPWDTDSSTSSVILDDELRNILDQFEGRVVVILDSCYSGGMPKADVEFIDNFITSTITELGGNNRVILMACAEDEYSYENSQLQSGVFSFYVIKGLNGPADSNSNGEITAVETFNYAKPKTTSYQSNQHPQMDKQGDDIAIIGGYPDSDVKVTVHMKRIKEIDEIDPLTEADWEYTVRLLSDQGAEIASHSVEERDDWSVNKDHVFNAYSPEVTLKIKLVENDQILGDVADISGSYGGGIDNWNVIYEWLMPDAIRGATYQGVYNIVEDEFVQGDKLVNSDGCKKTSGDFDGSDGWFEDENDAAVWFKISSNYKKPVVDAGGPYSAVKDSAITLHATVENGIGDYIFTWDLDNDGDFDDAEGKSIKHTWTQQGEFTIRVQVTDGFQVTDMDETTVTVEDNKAPYKPSISGPQKGAAGKTYTYSVKGSDPNTYDKLYYFIDWDDGTDTGWFGPFELGVEQSKSHRWDSSGSYRIKVKSKDTTGLESGWTYLSVSMPKNKGLYRLIDNTNNIFIQSILKIFIYRN